MKNRPIIITVVLLVIALGNYSRIFEQSNLRTVEFLNIFAIGALAGVLLTLLIKSAKKE